MTGCRPTALAALMLIAFTTQAQSLKPLVQADVSRVADTAHLEFKGLKTWRYDVQKDGEKRIVLSVPPVDEASVAKLKAFSDPHIAGIEVNKNGPDGTCVINFTLTSTEIEAFDYLTDDPSRLILDFYRKPEAEVKKPQINAEVAPAPAKSVARKSSMARVAKAKEGEYQEVKTGRTPAGDEFLSVEIAKQDPVSVATRFGIFDGGDENYDRFRIKDYEIREDAIIGSRHNIYLPFPMLKMKVSQLDKLLEQMPEFSIRAKDTKENKEARLLLTLFARKRQAVFLKTYDYFTKMYPESEYLEVIKNLAAHVYLERWRGPEGKAVDFDRAKALFFELVQKYPESPLREYNHALLGFAQLERGDALSTMQTFQEFLEKYPGSLEAPHARKALAESFVILRKYDDAAAQYEALIKAYPKSEHAYEARYRLGDVQFPKGDYNQAIRQYESAIKELPAQEKVFPNAAFNRAESHFWQKDYKTALNTYIHFVNMFPTHEHGGYALTRIGELLAILGADQRRVMGAFLESYFRFANHPGAKVARIRMLSQQMRSMKPKELKKALDEINDTGEKLNLPGMKEFTTLMIAEGLTSRGQYREALGNLISYYQKNPTNQDIFKSRVLRNIANEMKDNVEKGDFMKALEFYSQYSKTWLNNSDRIDVPFYLAGAYERAGAYPEAQAIYQEALASRKRIVGSDQEKEKKVQEHLPSVASLHLRLSSTLAQERDYIGAFQHLKSIGEGRDLSPAETVERVQLSALIAEQRNEPAKAREALLDLAKRWQGDPALVAPVNLQLAQIFMKLNDPKQAEAHADKVLEAEGGETPLPEKLIADAMTAKGDAQVAQKKGLSAVETYQKLLERFESKMPLASVRYRAGRILFDRGDMKGASDLWQPLQGGANELLYKLGREKLEDTKWRDEYNKYIDRIPAMSSRKSKLQEEAKQ